MRFRYLRIAFSAACGFACVLLIVLWVRSYSSYDYVQILKYGRGIAGTSWGGVFTAYASSNDNDYVRGRPWTVTYLNRDFAPWPWDQPWRFGSGSATIPHWFPVLISVTLAGAPWLRYRFSYVGAGQVMIGFYMLAFH